MKGVSDCRVRRLSACLVVTSSLADHGIATAVVPLPSCGEAGETLGDLYDDVDACRHAITEADEPVVLCGHSYGGVIITEAGADDRVTQLLYVTSVMPDAGKSQADLIGSEPAPWLAPSDDGTVGVDRDMIREFFLQDCCDESDRRRCARHRSGPPTMTAPHIPSTTSGVPPLACP